MFSTFFQMKIQLFNHHVTWQKWKSMFSFLITWKSSLSSLIMMMITMRHQLKKLKQNINGEKKFKQKEKEKTWNFFLLIIPWKLISLSEWILSTLLLFWYWRGKQKSLFSFRNNIPASFWVKKRSISFFLLLLDSDRKKFKRKSFQNKKKYSCFR